MTANSVVGQVVRLSEDRKTALLKTKSGKSVIAVLDKDTVYLRIPPGEVQRSKFIKLTAQDFKVGDQAYVRGRMAGDYKSILASEFYVMAHADIEEAARREREDWQRRGVSGVVGAISPERNEISLASSTAPNSPRITLSASSQVKFLRYANDSFRFSDAKPSSLSELRVGDQVRALGDKSADGTHFKSETIIAGSFRTFGGTVSAVNSEASEINLVDLQSKQPVTIGVNSSTSLRRMPPEVAATLAQALERGGQTQVNFQEMFEKLPVQALPELKPGTVIIVTTMISDQKNMKAVALVSGMDFLLKRTQAARSMQSLLTGGMGLAAMFGP